MTDDSTRPEKVVADPDFQPSAVDMYREGATEVGIVIEDEEDTDEE